MSVTFNANQVKISRFWFPNKPCFIFLIKKNYFYLHKNSHSTIRHYFPAIWNLDWLVIQFQTVILLRLSSIFFSRNKKIQECLVYLGTINVDKRLLLIGHGGVRFPCRWRVTAILPNNLSFTSVSTGSDLKLKITKKKI